VAGTVRFTRWKLTELCIGNREESVETLGKPVVPVGGRKKGERASDGRTDGLTDGKKQFFPSPPSLFSAACRHLQDH